MKKAVNCRWFYAWIAVVICLFNSGCTHSGFRDQSLASQALPTTLGGEFHYERVGEIPFQRRSLETNDEFSVERIKVRAAGEGEVTERWIEMDYYSLTGAGPHPIIMVLPMLGGGYSLERHFASYFAHHGYSSVIVHRDRRAKIAKVEDFDRLLRDTVFDHRRVIDWLELQPEVDGERVGVFGISMGGIKGALLVALEARIKAAILGLAGGDLPYILTHTTEPGLVKRRDQELAAQNITLQQAEERLRALITCDPIRYAEYVDPSKVLLVLARFDTVVPIEKGLELKTKMGNPETIMLPSGHYTAALSIPYIKLQSLAFFGKRMGRQAEKAVPHPKGAKRSSAVVSK